MTTSEEYTKEEQKGGDDIQKNDFISLSPFELLKRLLKRVCSPLMIYLVFYDVDVALDLAWEGELLDMESEYKLHPVSQ